MSYWFTWERQCYFGSIITRKSKFLSWLTLHVHEWGMLYSNGIIGGQLMSLSPLKQHLLMHIRSIQAFKLFYTVNHSWCIIMAYENHLLYCSYQQTVHRWHTSLSHYSAITCFFMNGHAITWNWSPRSLDKVTTSFCTIHIVIYHHMLRSYCRITGR